MSVEVILITYVPRYASVLINVYFVINIDLEAEGSLQTTLHSSKLFFS